MDGATVGATTEADLGISGRRGGGCVDGAAAIVLAARERGRAWWPVGGGVLGRPGGWLEGGTCWREAVSGAEPGADRPVAPVCAWVREATGPKAVPGPETWGGC